MKHGINDKRWKPVDRVYDTPCPTCGAGFGGVCDKDEPTTRTFVEGPPGCGSWFCQERVIKAQKRGDT